MASLSNTTTLDLTVKDDITFAVVDNSAFELIDSVGATAWLFKDSVNVVNRLQIAPTVIQFYGQTLAGDTGVDGLLILRGNTNATPNTNIVQLGTTTGKSGYDAINHRLGLQTLTPTEVLHLAAGNILLAAGNITGTFTSTAANGKGLSISHTGAITGTGYSGYFTKTGASTTNVALYASATGATNNYGLIVENGSVGIGTTGPESALHVIGKIAVGANTLQAPLYALTVNSGGTAVTGFGLMRLNQTQPIVEIYETTGDGKLAMYSGTVKNVFFDTVGSSWINGGNVGIGTTTPSAKLHLISTATYAAAGVSGFLNAAHTVTLSGAAPTTYATFFSSQVGALTLAGTNPNQTVTDAAAVNIASAPIKSTNVALTNTHGLLISAGAVSTATNSYGLTVNAQTGAGSNYAAVFMGGSVGIGNSSPSRALHITSSSSTEFLIEDIGVATGTNGRIWRMLNSGAIFKFEAMNGGLTGGINVMNINNEGKVSIGTAVPVGTALLTVNGNVAPASAGSFTLGISGTQWATIFANDGVFHTGTDGVGTLVVGGSSPAATAALEIRSTTKGLLLPRLTTAQRDAISSPAPGLIIFNPTNNVVEFVNNSAAWGPI